MRADVNGAPRLDSIESLRGVAAFLIVMYHLVELLALPIPSSLNVIRSHFGLGVPLFYVLSGFVLAWGCADRLAGGQEQIVAFYVRRFFRIAPLFYAVLVLWRGVGSLLWSWSTPSQSLVLNVSFLFGLVPGEHESLVMAGWSIGVEMLFYLVFPVLLVFLRGVISTAAGFLLACVLSAAVFNAFEAIGQGAYGYMNLFTQLPFFIAGMLCYQLWRARCFERGPVGWWCLAFAAIMVSLLVQGSFLQTILRDLRFGAMYRNVWALVFGALIYGACAARPLLLERGPLRWFGRLSFSVYLLHPIVMVFMIKQGMATWLIGLGQWQGFLAGSLIALALIACLSYVSHRWIELPGIAMGNRLLARGICATKSASPSIPAAQIEDKPLTGKGVGRFQRVLRVLDAWFGGAWMPRVLAGVSLAFVIWVIFSHLEQPIIDFHGFRQTQTALTSYWMQKEGWQLAYQTPVSGFPWAIPYEFPLYQTIVAGLSSLFGSPLEATGRLVSGLFLLACAWPAFALHKRLKIGETFPWVFCALLWTSPLYAFWGRAFLIDVAAIFFVLASLPYAIDISRGDGGWKSAALFVLLGALAMLQKSTTGGPAFLFVLVTATGVILRGMKWDREGVMQLAGKLSVLALPIAAGFAWSAYTEAVKAHNVFGGQLGFKSIPNWYLGTLAEKISLETYRLVLWERGFVHNAGGVVGAGLILLAGAYSGKFRKLALVVGAALGMFVLPVLIFTKLHIVHEYYQTANLVFLLGALAIVLSGCIPTITGSRGLAVLLTVVLVGANLASFRNPYAIILGRGVAELDPVSLRAYEIGLLLRDKTQVGTGIAVFGQDYSSEIPFYAQRKAAVLPTWYKNYQEFREHPERFLGGLALSAVVICPWRKEPIDQDVADKIAQRPNWMRLNVKGCEVLLSGGTS